MVLDWDCAGCGKSIRHGYQTYDGQTYCKECARYRNAVQSYEGDRPSAYDRRAKKVQPYAAVDEDDDDERAGHFGGARRQPDTDEISPLYNRRGFSGIISKRRKFIVGESGPEKVQRRKLDPKLRTDEYDIDSVTHNMMWSDNRMEDKMKKRGLL
jgi:hypothetical protein